MTALPALIALPVSAAVILALLRSPAASLLVKPPRGDRWRMDTMPIVGGIGIFAGILVALTAAAARGGFEPSTELLGIVGGCAIVFLAGLWDDIRSVGPLGKLAAQVVAASLVILTGTTVTIVGHGAIGAALAMLWLVGLTNAFNLLDNMDGLAATLAALAAGFFALDAYFVHGNVEVLALSVAVVLACVGFLPFNLRPGRGAAVFMGDSGSQVLGFALGALGLSAWEVAGSTVATLVLPLLVLGVPLLDTALVTVLRLLEGRPVSRGGRDHSSHRLVRYGLSEWHAVLLLAVVAAALGGTSLAFSVVDNRRLTLVGMLVTVVLLVQFASFLADLERRSPATQGAAPAGLLEAFDVHWRRLVEVVVDFALICGAFLASYVVTFGGFGTVNQKNVFWAVLPVLLAARYLAFVLFGLYRSIWRYAAARDLLAIGAAVVLSEAVAVVYLVAARDPGDFALRVFALDALLCVALVSASRFGERALLRAWDSFRAESARKTLIVGAGRAGRSLDRELRETPGERTVGFLDDNPRLRRRRVQGAAVHGTLADAARVVARTHADRVLVAIPDAPRERLELVTEACRESGVPCGFVRREIYLQQHDVALSATVE